MILQELVHQLVAACEPGLISNTAVTIRESKKRWLEARFLLPALVVLFRNDDGNTVVGVSIERFHLFPFGSTVLP